MRRRTFLSTVAATGTPLVAGCGGDDGPPEELTVSIEPIGNQPREGRVAVGGTVTWRNENSGLLNDHTVTATKYHDTAADWEFDEELPEEGDEVTYTFEEAGVYEYYDRQDGRACRCGAILVGDVELPGALPCVTSSPAEC